MVQVYKPVITEGFLYNKKVMDTPDFSSAIGAILKKRRVNQSELATILGVSRQAVYKKFQTNKFTLHDIQLINAHFGVDVLKIVDGIGEGKQPEFMVMESIAEYNRKSDYTVTLTSDEAKEILLAQTKTINELRSQMDELRRQFLEFKKS